MDIVPAIKVFILPRHTGISQTYQAYTTSYLQSCNIAQQSRIIITGIAASLGVMSGDGYCTCNQGIHSSQSHRYLADPSSLQNFLCQELYYCTAKQDNIHWHHCQLRGYVRRCISQRHSFPPYQTCSKQTHLACTTFGDHFELFIMAYFKTFIFQGNPLRSAYCISSMCFLYSTPVYIRCLSWMIIKDSLEHGA